MRSHKRIMFIQFLLIEITLQILYFGALNIFDIRKQEKKKKDQFGDCQTGLKNMSSVWHNYMLTYFLNYSFIK